MDTRFPITWTVKIVQETLVDAAWHCVVSGKSAFPGEARMSLWDDIATPPDDEDDKERQLRRRLSPARISFLERAILWPMAYLGDDPENARMLQIWLWCKVSKRKFRDEVDRRGIARATAYRRRDRALTLISVGLDRDGVPLWGE